MKTEEKFKAVFLEKVFFRENEPYKASVIYFFIKNSRNKHIFLVEKDFEKNLQRNLYLNIVKL